MNFHKESATEMVTWSCTKLSSRVFFSWNTWVLEFIGILTNVLVPAFLDLYLLCFFFLNVDHYDQLYLLKLLKKK